jgi:hypothetical protein
MFSGSMDPCRDNPRVACTGAISPRLKRHVGCCHITNVIPHEQPFSKFLPKERCINTGYHSPFITREISWVYQTRFSFSRQKQLRSRPLLRAGQSPVNRTTKGPAPQGGQQLTAKRGSPAATCPSMRRLGLGGSAHGTLLITFHMYA